MRFTFSPSEKAFGKTEVLRTRDFHIDTEDGRIRASVDGTELASNVVAYCAAFGLKQILANSYASAGTAKNKEGGLLDVKERLALWQSSFDKRLDKLVKGEGDWRSVFDESGARETTDPLQVEVNKIVRAKLVAWADKKGKSLPKVGSDEYKALCEKLLDAQGDAIRKTAQEILDVRNGGADDDFDLD